MSIRDQILNAQKLKTETVKTPEWGSVIVSEVPALTRLALYKEIQERGGEDSLPNLLAMAMLVVRSVVDEAGARVFEDTDAEALTRKNQDSLTLVFNVSARLNGIAPPEDIAGNSQPGSSPSA